MYSNIESNLYVCDFPVIWNASWHEPEHIQILRVICCVIVNVLKDRQDLKICPDDVYAIQNILKPSASNHFKFCWYQQTVTKNTFLKFTIQNTENENTQPLHMFI